MQCFKAIVKDSLSGLCPQPLPPVRLGQHVSHLDFGTLVNRPWQEPASPDETVGFFMNGRPESQFRVVWMAIEKPFQFLFRFFVSQRAFREVPSYVRIAVKRE
jgi:hypothetical protein